jgi:hypothetical protein
VSLRLLAVIAEISVGTVVVAWGIASACRPSSWTLPGARWWVGWTSAPVARTHGVAVAVVGVGLLVCAVATALTAPAAPIPALARDVQLVGLAVVVLGGVALAATHPGPENPATAASIAPPRGQPRSTPPQAQAPQPTAGPTTDTPPALTPTS